MSKSDDVNNDTKVDSVARGIEAIQMRENDIGGLGDEQSSYLDNDRKTG